MLSLFKKLKPRLNINENFICRIWEGGEKYLSGLVADSGEDVEVIDKGTRNFDSGPDYKNAKIKIGEKVLTGDVEIHRDHSNWVQHDHHNDRRYISVILHVVLWDSPSRTAPKLRIKRELPTVILQNHLTKSIHDIWKEIISEPSDKFRLPCFANNSTASDEELVLWLGKLSVERLKLRAERIRGRLSELSRAAEKVLPKNRPLWEQALYEFIFEALGFSKNKEQMQSLAASAGLDTIRKFSGSKIDGIQAILFGTSGLLFDVRTKDPYTDNIKEIWRELSDKIKNPRLQRSEWAFFGQRPQNYPTIRIAYGSQIIYSLLNKELFRALILVFEDKEFKVKQAVEDIMGLLEPAADEYWNSHYDFGKASKAKNILAGRQRITDILINVIVPLLYLYSAEFDKKQLRMNVLKLYNEFPSNADNSVLRVMQSQLLGSRGVKSNSVAMEQGLIQLHNFYCTREKCDKCIVGRKVIESSGDIANGSEKEKGFEYKIIYY